MKKEIILSACLIIFMLSSCSENFYEMESRSVFVEDINNLGLPEYSEWGYNTFGAYFDRSVFVSNDNDLPAKVIVTNDTFNIRLSGKWKDVPLTIKFSVVGYSPSDFTDLVSLNDRKINLALANSFVTMIYDGKTERLNVYEGELYFKRVQKLYVDKELSEVILSGTFKFKTFFGGEPIAISKGRFDLGIEDDNFYKF